MKNYLKLLIAVFLVSSVMSCGKSDSNNNGNSNNLTAAKVRSDMTNGSWKITFLYRDSVNTTSDFAGYTFTFNESGIVNASNSLINNPGNWSTSEIGGAVKFQLSFMNPAGFVKLNNNWTVVSSTGISLRLIGTSTNGSLSDQLLFEKI